ncbi:cathepsin d [Plakobranchus ocellatus]|uniref:Cathepsin d n=1 Tax=Plakobranchus ocellatus TaxID=259542 RepID=A0AAV3ZKK7_9GAST|nr:cathepsin d [Plakobranchus ocellatus]
MNFSAHFFFVLTLVSICEAYSSGFPVAQARKLVLQRTRFTKRLWPSRHRLQSVRQANQRPVQSSFQRFQSTKQNFRQKRIGRDVKLTNHRDKLYSCPITIGFPGQEFNVALDTSSSMTWVPSIHAPPEYRRMRLKIKNQSFGEALLEPDLFWRTKNDGILGLGFNNIDGDEEPSVFDNMVSQGLVQAPVFSIYLNRYGSSGPDSVLTLGGTNPYYFEEDFIFADLTVPHRWQFKIDRVQLSSGDSIFSKSGYQAVVDSSSSFVAGPFEETRVINQQLGGKSFIGHHGLYNYKFDCSEVDNLPDVEFIVNGQKLSLSGRDYTARMKLKAEDICASRILAMGWRKNDEADWVLGLNFMRAYCTQFDKGNRRIGFAKTYSYEDIITREPL